MRFFDGWDRSKKRKAKGACVRPEIPTIASAFSPNRKLRSTVSALTDTHGPQMELTRKRIPEKVKQIRATLGLTLFEMAERISEVVQVKLSSENVADFEQDKEVPPLEVVLAYARIGKTQMESIIDDNLELTEVLEFRHRESSSA